MPVSRISGTSRLCHDPFLCVCVCVREEIPFFFRSGDRRFKKIDFGFRSKKIGGFNGFSVSGPINSGGIYRICPIFQMDLEMFWLLMRELQAAASRRHWMLQLGTTHWINIRGCCTFQQRQLVMRRCNSGPLFTIIACRCFFNIGANVRTHSIVMGLPHWALHQGCSCSRCGIFSPEISK